MKKLIFTLFIVSISFCGTAQLKSKKYERNVTNNSENEIAPFLSLDGKTLIYTRKRAMDEQWKTQISTFENGKWQRPTTFDLLNLFPEQRLLGSYALNYDASKVIFVSKKRGGVGSFDLWISTKTSPNNWSTPINLAKPVNSTKEEINPIFSQDEKSIFFVRRTPGEQNGEVYQASIRSSGLWNEPKKLPFSNQFFAIRIAADNKTMYLSKITGQDKILMYVSRLINNNWSTPQIINDFPENCDKYFALNAKSTHLTISMKKDLTYDLFQIKLPDAHQSTDITILNININEPHKIKISKQEDKKFSFLSSNINNYFLLNDDKYTISILFKNHLPIVNEVDLNGKAHSSKTLSPKPIKLESGAVSYLDFFNPDSTVNASLFKKEIEALKAFATANSQYNFEINYYQKVISYDSVKTATHYTIVQDTTTEKKLEQSIKTIYSNNTTLEMLNKIKELCGDLPKNITLKIRDKNLESLKSNRGVVLAIR